MRDTSKIIAFIIDGVILLFITLACAMLYNLKVFGHLPPFLEMLNIPFALKMFFELFYYFVLIYFFTGRKFDLRNWGFALALFFSFRIFMSVANSLVFFYLSTGAERQVPFIVSYMEALYDYDITYILQVLIVPWLSYPLLGLFLASMARSSKNIIEELKPREPEPTTDWSRLVQTVPLVSSDWQKLLSEERTAEAESTVTQIAERLAEPDIVEMKPLEVVQPASAEALVHRETEMDEQTATITETMPQAKTEEEKITETTSMEQFEPVESSAEDENEPSVSEAGEEVPADVSAELAPMEETLPPPPIVPDRVVITVMRLIKANEGKEGAEVLSKLLRRGADFKLEFSIDEMTKKIEHNDLSISVGYIYDQAPLEAIDFLSSDHSYDLSKYILEIPMDDVIPQLSTVLETEKRGEESELSYWARESEKMGEKVIFEEDKPAEEMPKKAVEGEAEPTEETVVEAHPEEEEQEAAVTASVDEEKAPPSEEDFFGPSPESSEFDIMSSGGNILSDELTGPAAKIMDELLGSSENILENVEIDEEKTGVDMEMELMEGVVAPEETPLEMESLMPEEKSADEIVAGLEKAAPIEEEILAEEKPVEAVADELEEALETPVEAAVPVEMETAEERPVEEAVAEELKETLETPVEAAVPVEMETAEEKPVEAAPAEIEEKPVEKFTPVPLSDKLKTMRFTNAFASGDITVALQGLDSRTVLPFVQQIIRVLPPESLVGAMTTEKVTIGFRWGYLNETAGTLLLLSGEHKPAASIVKELEGFPLNDIAEKDVLKWWDSVEPSSPLAPYALSFLLKHSETNIRLFVDDKRLITLSTPLVLLNELLTVGTFRDGMVFSSSMRLALISAGEILMGVGVSSSAPPMGRLLYEARKIAKGLAK